MRCASSASFESRPFRFPDSVSLAPSSQIGQQCSDAGWRTEGEVVILNNNLKASLQKENNTEMIAYSKLEPLLLK